MINAIETEDCWADHWQGFLRGERTHDDCSGFWCSWDRFIRGEDHPE